MISATVLLDTGPLVAYLNRRDSHHAWARDPFGEITPPLLTCEAVISEACSLTRQIARGSASVLQLMQRGVVRVQFSVSEELESVSKLMNRYTNIPMSLADACLVRMSEMVPDCTVITIDRDFRVYRRHHRRTIPVLIPPNL